MGNAKKNKTRQQPLWITITHIIAIIVLLAGIQFSVSTGLVNRIFLASPTQILDEFLYVVSNDILWPHFSLSLQEFAVGYTISAVVGVVVGVLFVSFPMLEKLLSPFAAAVMAVPKTAVLPLLIIWFGIGFKSKVILVVLFCVFNILFNTITGAKQTRAEHLKVAKVFKASKMQTVFKILIPSALPSIFNGLRVTAATAITGVIFAEMTAAKKGLGYLLTESQAVLNTPRLFLVIIIVTVLSVLFVSIVDLLERFICKRWRNN